MSMALAKGRKDTITEALKSRGLYSRIIEVESEVEKSQIELFNYSHSRFGTTIKKKKKQILQLCIT